MAGDGLVLECLGCGGDVALEPAWDEHDSSQPWRGGMRLIEVDGRVFYAHDEAQCVSCALDPF